jgi:hypothetical protein
MLKKLCETVEVNKSVQLEDIGKELKQRLEKEKTV